MAYTAQSLPFAAGSHESHQAAVRAAETRGDKTRAYLRLLARRGPLTDHEVRTSTGWPLSSVNSIRNGAMKCGLVEKGDYAKTGPYERACRVWQLTDAGRVAVEAMRQE